ncbi:MAG: o-succinylbenzoate synthase [Chloroflexi bacterium CFX4]|nr:o-succinylbenzoate synthase [Chloroflexi bacterium CFX4]MDL1922292.1 o-succinylbenzoate synthase [Chloroflexi bacterium CFX3]
MAESYPLRAESPISHIRLHPIAMPLVENLVTSFGSDGGQDSLRAAVLVELELASGITGWGECVASWAPGYSYETTETALHVLRDFFIPGVLGQHDLGKLHAFRGHPMARMALETAFWSAVATERNLALGDLLGSGAPRKGRATVGVSIGIQPSIDATLAIIEKRLDEGYQRIKLKIKRGWDVDLMRAVRSAYPDIMLMADANSAYTLDDAPLLKQLDDLNLLMIEQPLGYLDIYQHGKLQPQFQTPICLDESIHTADDVRLMLQIGAGRIINLKPARVGGLIESLKIHEVCRTEGVPLWIGGMLETGVGRAANLALASLSGVTLPSDISATNRYYDPDLTEEVFTLNAEDSTIDVPQGIGLGVSVDRERLAAAEVAYYKAAAAVS